MKFETPASKAVAVGCSVLTIALAAWLFWRQHQDKPEEKMPQHVAMGHALGEEAVKALENRKKKRVLIVSAKGDPALQVQLDALLATLKQHPDIELKDGKPDLLESDEKSHFRPGSGLSARRFKRVVEHNLKADCFVSLVGAPKPDDAELAGLTVKRFIAETGDRDRVEGLIAKQMLIVAIVPRFEFPSPVKEPRTEQEWFDKYYQIIRAPKATNDVKAAKSATTTPPASSTIQGTQ